PTPPSLSACPAPTAIYPLSLHDALPISGPAAARRRAPRARLRWGPPGVRSVARARARRTRREGPPTVAATARARGTSVRRRSPRSEEHTSELQSLRHLVCRLLLEKKKPK